MSTNDATRRHRNALLVAALARGASYTEAARIAGISKATVSRRMREPAFRAEVNDAREQVIDRVRGYLNDATPSAARALVEVATEGASESTRVAAASRILDIVLRRRPGFDTYSESEVTAIVTQILELSVRRMPTEVAAAFLGEVRAIGVR